MLRVRQKAMKLSCSLLVCLQLYSGLHTMTTDDNWAITLIEMVSFYAMCIVMEFQHKLGYQRRHQDCWLALKIYRDWVMCLVDVKYQNVIDA